MTEYLDSDQVDAFALRLLEVTEANKLAWTRDSESEYSFKVTVDQFVYRVKSNDNDDFHPYSLIILRRFVAENGARKLQVLQKVETDSAEHGTTVDSVSALYRAVKRSVLGLDKVALDIMSSLDDL